MIAVREVVARFWPAPVLLLVGLIAAESAFEDRAGSGNITDIQHNAERSPPRLAHASENSGSSDEEEEEEEEEEPAWFSKDGPGNAAAMPQTELAPPIESGDLLDRGGARIPMPEQGLIESAPLPI